MVGGSDDRERDLPREAEERTSSPFVPLAPLEEPALARSPAAAEVLRHGDSGAKSQLLHSLQRSRGNAAVARLIRDAAGESPGRPAPTGPAKNGPVGLGAVLARQHQYHDEDPTVAWDDFQGGVPKKAKHDAATAYGVDPVQFDPPKLQFEETEEACSPKSKKKKWKARVDYDPVSEIDVRAFFDPSSSWVKPGHETAPLLEHEQGHFDIAHVIAEKIEIKMEEDFAAKNVGEWVTKCGKNPAHNAAVAGWNKALPAAIKHFKKGLKLIKKAQKDYDVHKKKGTAHGTKAAEQAAWVADIANGLPDYNL